MLYMAVGFFRVNVGEIALFGIFGGKTLIRSRIQHFLLGNLEPTFSKLKCPSIRNARFYSIISTHELLGNHWQMVASFPLSGIIFYVHFQGHILRFIYSETRVLFILFISLDLS